MAEPFPLTGAQMRRIEPYFPLSRGQAREDDRRAAGQERPARGFGGAKGARAGQDGDVSGAGPGMASDALDRPKARVPKERLDGVVVYERS